MIVNLILFTYFIYLIVESIYYALHKNLKYYEILHSSSFQHRIVKRGAQHSYHPYNKISELDFYTHGRNFRLILTPRKEVIHSKFKAYEVDGNGRETSVHIDHDNFYHGRVFGESNSHVQLNIDDNGILLGSISVPDDTYHIEPSWRHLPENSNETMIIYKASDVKLSWEHYHNGEGHTHGAPKTCGYIKEDNEPIDVDLKIEETSHNRSRRQTESYEYTPTKTRCPLLLVADYRFYQEMGASSTKTTINYLV
ncbi:unnamed protein product [Trichogramma brassicae]|uniref:Uncharacterized protein n=1 Tax=Trichogramma brassicae TaxID=86971 RepID=A0A6H5IPM1_9HYME|nr:unnamed protein product [Trichogramma brassicae]